VIKHTFGVLKKHFKILLLSPAYGMDIQAQIPAALCALCNFIREHESDDNDQTPNQDGIGETLHFIIFTLYLSLVYSRVCVVFGLSPGSKAMTILVLSRQLVLILLTRTTSWP
jgi:hypothetical protein